MIGPPRDMTETPLSLKGSRDTHAAAHTSPRIDLTAQPEPYSGVSQSCDTGCAAAPFAVTLLLRQPAGGMPNSRLNARLNAASDS